MTDVSAAPDAWITLPTPAEIRARSNPDARPLYDFGFVGMMSRLLAAHPRIGPAFAGFYRAVMFDSQVLSRQECELVAAVATTAQDCTY